ncbi:ATP-binding protein [Sporolactobacillus shoreicorticis]|uniref:ATP-binding protein n=1 Tax=Sporolactobacillus shoreicorticis TaxID=1923877 RepID=A0ABW5S016_9BACL|nr:ATP-binding protein [Sporolactobacillus shoreicorticis]MCO7125138.1 ATP-binding protein [Sporolactobacillus shoreicorticis]
MVEISETSAIFQFSPRIILESLGSKIIESDSIAIAEQIKNAVDAGSKDKVIVDFSRINEDLITITDSGQGMSVDEIKENWFFVSTDNKLSNNRMLGEKGIGRFSLFRLADKIEIETIKAGYINSFTLDKDELRQKEYISDFHASILSRENVESNNIGTTIYLRNLKSNINLFEIQRELQNLNEPEIDDMFTIIYPTNYDQTIYYPIESFVKNAAFHAIIELNDEEIQSYEFSCKIQDKSFYENNSTTTIQRSIENKNLKLNTGKTKIIIHNFYDYKKIKPLLTYSRSELQEHFLSAYQGINVYRNYFKIYGHGEVDWLKLAERRVKKVSDHIDNKLTFGYIILDPDRSIELEEKTNREGFLRNNELINFKEIILLILDQFDNDINNVKYIIRTTNLLNTTSVKVDSKQDLNNNDCTDNNNKSYVNSSNPKNNTGDKTEEQTKEKVKEQSEEQTTDNDRQDEDESPKTESSDKKQYHFEPRIGTIDKNIFDSIRSEKVKELVNEITSIYAYKYKLATAFLLRSFFEVAMNEYIINNFDSVKKYNNNMVILNDLIKQKFYNKSNQEVIKDLSIKQKIDLFIKKFRNNNVDPRSINHLNKLVKFIDDINLAIHWKNKVISLDELQTHWLNTKFFIEFLCKNV